MKGDLMSFFTLFGIVASVAALITIIVFIIMKVYYFIVKKIEKLKYDYKTKHRFDKPPLAKCYCKDCKYHEDNGECYSFTKRYTADNWFCAWAEKNRK
jgi:hypothetical protein